MTLSHGSGSVSECRGERVTHLRVRHRNGSGPICEAHSGSKAGNVFARQTRMKGSQHRSAYTAICGCTLGMHTRGSACVYLDVRIPDNFLEFFSQVVHAVEEFSGLRIEVLPTTSGRGRRSDHSTRVQVHMRIRTADVLVHEQRSVQRESLDKAGIMSGGGGSGWGVGSQH